MFYYFSCAGDFERKKRTKTCKFCILTYVILIARKDESRVYSVAARQRFKSLAVAQAGLVRTQA